MAQILIFYNNFFRHILIGGGEWGGSIDNRTKFIVKVIEQVTKIVKEEKSAFIVGYRLSPEEIERPGITFSDTVFLIKRLIETPIDYIHISQKDFNQISSDEKYQERSMLSYIYEVVNGRIPIIGVGGVTTQEDTQKILKDCDLIAVGTSLLLDPHWASKILANQEKFIRNKVYETEIDDLKLTRGQWEMFQMINGSKR